MSCEGALDITTRKGVGAWRRRKQRQQNPLRRQEDPHAANPTPFFLTKKCCRTRRKASCLKCLYLGRRHTVQQVVPTAKDAQTITEEQLIAMLIGTWLLRDSWRQQRDGLLLCGDKADETTLLQ